MREGYGVKTVDTLVSNYFEDIIARCGKDVLPTHLSYNDQLIIELYLLLGIRKNERTKV